MWSHWSKGSLIPTTVVPIRRGDLETDTQHTMWTKKQPWGDVSISQGTPKMPGNPQKLGKGWNNGSSEGTNPTDTLILDLWPPELWDNTSLSCQLPSLLPFVMAALTNYITRQESFSSMFWKPAVHCGIPIWASAKLHFAIPHGPSAVVQELSELGIWDPGCQRGDWAYLICFFFLHNESEVA